MPIFGIAPERVIGSYARTKRDGKTVLIFD